MFISEQEVNKLSKSEKFTRRQFLGATAAGAAGQFKFGSARHRRIRIVLRIFGLDGPAGSLRLATGRAGDSFRGDPCEVFSGGHFAKYLACGARRF